MKSKALAPTLFFAALMAGHASVVTWDAGGGGVNWSDPLNWSGDFVPTTTNDVVLGSGAMVVISGNYTVLSVQSQRPLAFNGASLAVTAGASEVKGTLSLAQGDAITVTGAGTTFLATNTVSAAGASFNASSGGQLRLPGLESFSKTDGCYDLYCQVFDAGSVLDLSGVTNIYGGNCGGLHFRAFSGGQIVLSNLVSVSGAGSLEAYTDGTNCLIDLSKLASYTNTSGVFYVEARNAGRVMMPLMVDGSQVGITERNGGVLDTAQLTRVAGVTVDNTVLVLPAVTNVDGIALSLQNGGRLSLPLVKSISKTDGCYETYWQVSGAGSVLDLSTVTNIYGGNCGGLHMESYSGGQIVLSNLVTLTGHNYVTAYTDGGIIDLRKLAAFTNSDAVFSVEARNAGQVMMPLMVDGSRVGITERNGGVLDTVQLTRVAGVTVDNTVLSLPAVTNVDGIALSVQNGGQLSLPLVKSISKTDGCYETYWQVSGAGSVLDLTTVTNIYGGNCGGLHMETYSGGQIMLSNLVTLTGHSYVTAYADGAGSVVDLRKLAAFTNSDAVFSVEARNAGQVMMPLMVDGSRVGITERNGGVLDTVQLTRVAGVTADNTVLVLPAVTNVDGIALSVQNGGRLSLPLVKSISKTDGCYETYWQVSGAGSVLDLTTVTNIYGGNCGGLHMESYSGGQIVLSNLVALTGHNYVTAYADGAGSVVDLRKLAAFTNSDAVFSVEARNAGQVIIPLLVDGSRVGVTERNGGVLDTAQLTRVAGVTVDNTALVLPAVTNVDGIALSVQNGGRLSLPLVKNISKTDGCYETYWQVSGAGSVLDLTTVTNIYGGNCGGLHMESYSGGQIVLSNLVALTGHNYVTAYADGGMIDLRKLAAFTNSDAVFYVEARNAGDITLRSLADGRRVVLTLRNGGVTDTAQFTRLAGVTLENSVATLPALTNLDAAVLSVSAGGQLTLPALQLETKTPGCYDQTWQVSGTGSRIVAPALTTLIGGNCGTLYMQANSGGQLVLSNLSSIAGSAIAILADGGGSVVDLSKLNSFIAPVAPNSSLTAQNGGVILLGTPAFLLANVSVNIPPGNPVLPPVFISGPNLTLYGTAWLSYLIEQQSMLTPGAPWQFYTRVPLTNSFQEIGGPPPANTAYRITEFVAAPSILDFSVVLQQAQLVLYGATNITFQVETTTNLVDAASWTIYSVANMTNSFRILPSIPATEPVRFFRAKQL